MFQPAPGASSGESGREESLVRAGGDPVRCAGGLAQSWDAAASGTLSTSPVDKSALLWKSFTAPVHQFALSFDGWARWVRRSIPDRACRQRGTDCGCSVSSALLVERAARPALPHRRLRDREARNE